MTAAYPAHWEADILLSDGGTAHLRPIRPDDADRMRAFHLRLSPTTIYYRFFSRMKTLSEAQITWFTTVDYVYRVAFIVLVGDDMIAVGRYEGMAGSTEAEVAFLVEDAHQGRGIGSVLLEHLASAAAERGIRRFVADVLSENRAMIGVFLDAGYTVDRAYDQGTIQLTFDIAPTEQAVSVARAREHSAESRSIARLLHPRSVAVVGASRDPHAAGHVALRNLRSGGFAGTVYAVNRAAAGEPVAGVVAYGSVSELPGGLDLAVVATPAAMVHGVVEECAAAGAHGLVVLTDMGSAAADSELVAAARARGMRVVGPASLGMMDTATGLNASLAPALPPPGKVGCYSQSGALGLVLLTEAARSGCGVSSFVSAGDRADVSGNDLLQFWEEDPDTTVALLSIESFGNPRKFARLARRVGRRMPVIVVSVSRGPVEDALLRQAGVIRVDRADQAFGIASLLVGQPPPPGRRLGVVSDSAALTRLTQRACEIAGLTATVVTVPPESVPEVYADAFVEAAQGADALLSVAVPPPWRGDASDIASALALAAARTGLPTVATVLGAAPVPPELGAVPAYETPEDAVAALAAVAGYAEWLALPPGTVPAVRADRARARRAVDVADGPLPPAAAAELLDAYGVAVRPARAVASADEAVAAADALGWPVALKARAPAYRHRVDLGAVRLDLADAAELRHAWTALTARLGTGPYVVQSMAPPGVSVVVGSVEDPTQGPLVSFGLAGVASDLLGDVAYHIVPLTDLDAAALVRSVRAAPLLYGWRGGAAVDVAALEDLLLRVAQLADDLPRVASLSLNPVVVGPGGLSVLAAEVTVEAPRPRGDVGPRRLRVGTP